MAYVSFTLFLNDILVIKLDTTTDLKFYNRGYNNYFEKAA